MSVKEWAERHEFDLAFFQFILYEAVAAGPVTYIILDPTLSVLYPLWLRILMLIPMWIVVMLCTLSAWQDTRRWKQRWGRAAEERKEK